MTSADPARACWQHDCPSRSSPSNAAAEVERLCHERGIGLSEVVKALAHRGMAAAETPASPYEHHSTKLGLKVDMRNIGEVLDLLDEGT